LFYNVIADIIKKETGENEDDIETEAQYTWDYSEEPPVRNHSPFLLVQLLIVPR